MTEAVVKDYEVHISDEVITMAVVFPIDLTCRNALPIPQLRFISF